MSSRVGAYKFRMVTYHAGKIKWWESPSPVEDAAYTILEAVDKAGEEGFGRPDTVRLTLAPAPSLSEASEHADELGSIADDSGVLVNLGYYPSTPSPDDIADYIKSIVGEGLYLSILLEEPSWPHARAIARVLHSIAEEDVDASTRVGVNALGEPVLTPYYPLSSTTPGRTAVTVGLTYPRHLLGAYLEGGVEAVVDAAARAGEDALRLSRRVASHLTAEGVGVDLSVAPWMEDSSLALVETVAGVRLPEPGIAMGISAVNQALIRAAERVGGGIGFNEVQLPVGEDSKLKARVSEGDTRARDLARLAGACLAGLDMTVIPFDERGVAGLILEVASYAIVKRRPLGVRVIPLDGVEAGDKVSLKRFGEIPVIEI